MRIRPDVGGKVGRIVVAGWLIFFACFASASYSKSNQMGKLIGELKHRDVRIRGKAIIALGKLGDAGAIKPLMDILIKDDEYYDNQWKAAWALGQIGEPAEGFLNALINQTPCEKGHEIYELVGNNFPAGVINEPQECREKTGITGKLGPGDTIMVSGLLNGTHQVEFFLDTGSTFVLITEEDAQALELDLSNAPMVKGRLADGRIIENPMIKLDSIKIGSSEARDVITAVTKHGKVRLLGMSFLNKFPNMKINWETGEVILE